MKPSDKRPFRSMTLTGIVTSLVSTDMTSPSSSSTSASVAIVAGVGVGDGTSTRRFRLTLERPGSLPLDWGKTGKTPAKKMASEINTAFLANINNMNRRTRKCLLLRCYHKNKRMLLAQKRNPCSLLSINTLLSQYLPAGKLIIVGTANDIAVFGTNDQVRPHHPDTYLLSIARLT